MKRFVKVCAGSAALALGIAIVPMLAAAGSAAQAASSAANSASPFTSRHVSVQAPRTVNARAVSRMAVTAHAGLAPPTRYFNPSLVASQRAAAASTGGRRSGVVTLAPKSPALRAVTTPTTLADFPTMSLSTQVADLGSDQNVEPPDTQIAAGPNNVVETLNDSFSVWPKTGGSPTLVLDLNNFFSVPAGQSFTDPRILYDAQSGRWFLSGWSFDSTLTNTETYLAVSKTSDPTGAWNVTILNASSTSELTDQPMIGVCSDKVVYSWNDFTNSSGTYNGAIVLVLQKSALVAGTAVAGAAFITSEFRVVPAQSLSPTSTCWATINDADTALGGSSTSPTIGVVSFTGSPTGTVTANEANLPITATSPPPAPAEPGGTVDASTANDDRFLSAVWQNNELWTSATDSCTPTGDTTVRNCMRLIEVSTAGSTPSVLQDFDAATSGLDEYYPAVSLSYTGDLFVSYTASSSSQFPGAYAVISPASAAGQSPLPFTSPVTVQAGSNNYTGTRWGDYSAAAPDPSQPGAVWVAGEYAPADASTPDWGTAAAELTLASSPALAMAVEGAGGVPYAQAPQLGAGWHSLGGQVVGPPAVAAAPNADGTAPASPLFIATGTTKLMYIRSLSTGWKQVGPVAGSCLGSPAAVITGSTLTVACRGTNNALYYNQAAVPSSGLPQFTSGWKNLGGVLTAAPAVAPVGGTLTFFVPGIGGRIYTRTLTTGFAAQPWTCLGAPAAALPSPGGAAIFACEGTNRALYWAANTGSGWPGATSLGGTLTGGPAIAATSRVPLFLGEGTTKAVYERTLTAGFSSLGGSVVNGVGAAALN